MFSSHLNCDERCNIIHIGDLINFPKKETSLLLCLLLDQEGKTWGVGVCVYVHKHILKSNLKRLTSDALRLFNHMHDNVIMHTHLPIWKEDTKKPKEEKVNNYTTRLRNYSKCTDIFCHMEVLNMRNQGKACNFAGQKLEKIKNFRADSRWHKK